LEDFVTSFKDKVHGLKSWGAQLVLGTEIFWDVDSLSNSITLEPGRETGIFNEFFLAVHSTAFDELEIEITYLEDDFVKEASKKIPLVQYQNKNEYIFPVKGAWQVNGNYDCIIAHRSHYSMEFAFDIAQMNSDMKIYSKDQMQDTDFPAFGKDILAIADGEVLLVLMILKNKFNLVSIRIKWVKFGKKEKR
jgi:hypothetical protein